MEFFVGQRLVCVKDYHSLANGGVKKGDTYVVEELARPGSSTIRVRRDRDGYVRALNMDRFVEAAPSNIGDD